MQFISYEIPEWLQELETKRSEELFVTPESRVLLTVELAEINVKHGGGPFGAAIIDREGRIVSLGVNLVTTSGFSLNHAEIVAIMAAQKRLKTHDLHSYNLELVTSCEPCVMCHGATQWSGVQSLLFGATKDDAESIGFDEGDKHDEWRSLLEARGIKVTGPVERERAACVLFEYKQRGGVIYNPDGE
ncbi:nucleoside deaminase [bacterium]|nr:nucleoside deaminase [bacterium]